MSSADKTKLNGVEALANVTDDENVRASLAAATADIAVNTQKITGVVDPTANQDAATKSYVDAIVLTGVFWKQPVRIASTANLTLSGEQTIDGFLTSADRILVKDQSTGADNGIYVTAAGAWSRSTDADADAEVIAGIAVYVAEGTANGDKAFTLTTDDPITVGSTALTFAQFSGGAGDTLPVLDTISIVEDTADPTKEMRIDVGAVATGTVRVLTMPDQDVDLDPAGSGTFQARDDDLTAFAGLSSAANKIAYFTGAATMALANFTSQARNLLDDVTFAAMRATLGFVAAILDKAAPGEIGGTTPAAGNFTTLDLTGTISGNDNELNRVELKDIGYVINAIGSIGGGTQDIDLTLGNFITGTVDTSATTFTFSNPAASGTAFVFTLVLVNGESQGAITWPASVSWITDGGEQPVLLVSGTDILTFLTIDGGATWYGLSTTVSLKRDWKNSVRVATTGDVTLSGEQTIDGVSTSTDRILVKDQSTGSENGLYVTAAGAWTRTVDADADVEVSAGLAVTVEEGTLHADTQWVLTTDDPITVGTTALTFSQFAGSDAVTASSTTTFTNKTLDDDSNMVHAIATDVRVRNVSGSTITAGQVVYITGYNSGQDRLTVDLADADDAAKMPAIGLAEHDIATNANGQVVEAGLTDVIDTSAFSVGDEVYVSTTAGALTATKPTSATTAIQKIGLVVRSHASLGRIIVVGSGRENDIPNSMGEYTQTGNVTVDGGVTYDGRDVSADGGKLDTVETAADVTDAANVDAAGAIVHSDVSEATGFLRKTASETYVAVDGVFAENAIINGEGSIQQVADYTLVKDVYDYAGDQFEGMATGTAVNAGTLTTVENATAGATGHAHKFSGVTLTGTGILYHRTRIESRAAVRFKNRTASLSVVVRHDVGSAKTFTLYVRKANVKNDFSAVTAVANDGGTAVATATTTTLEFENISMGDVTNGIELELKMEVGAITTKNVEVTEWQLELGSEATPFEPDEDAVLAKCQRFYEKSYDQGAYPGVSFVAGARHFQASFSGTFDRESTVFAVVKRTNPSMTIYSTTGASGKWRNITDASDLAAAVTGVGHSSFTSYPTAATTAERLYNWQWTADARL